MKLAALADMWLQYPVGTKDEVATLVGGNCGDNTTEIRLGHLLYSLEPFIELLRKTRDRLFRYCEPWLGADRKSPREQGRGRQMVDLQLLRPAGRTSKPALVMRRSSRADSQTLTCPA